MSVSNTEKAVKDIRRNTRRKYSTEEKIRIVLDGLRGESSIAEICRREGINSNLYYRWSKDFLEAGKKLIFSYSLISALTVGTRQDTAGKHFTRLGIKLNIYVKYQKYRD